MPLPPRHERDGNDPVPYDEWPPAAQAAFEVYYALPDRSILALAKAEGVKSSPRTLGTWSSRYSWRTEVARRDAQAAAEARIRTDQLRRDTLDNADSGMANLVTAYAQAASGVCPQCRGTGKMRRPAQQDTFTCSVCGGSGVFEVMKVSVKGFVAAYNALYGVWSYVRSAGGEEAGADSSITPEEQRRRSQEMMRDAGLDALEAGDLEEDDGMAADEGEDA